MTKWIRIASVACALFMSTSIVHAQEARQIQGFSVVLIVGEAEASAVPDGLSAPARKALADIKDFLPYKGYRVLDTQWVAGTDRSHMEVRLQGMNNQDYVLGMTTERAQGGSAIRATVLLSNPHIPGGQTLINTTLKMSVGETVVVGTSRAQGDKALIALLTAVARQ